MSHFRFRRSFGNVGTRRFRGARPDITPPVPLEEDLLFTVDASINPNSTLYIGFDIYATSQSGTIDWGDGSPLSTFSGGIFSMQHLYSSIGIFQVRISGSLVNYISFNTEPKLISVDNLGKLGYTSLGNMFSDCVNLTSFTSGNTDSSNVTRLVGMFRGCTSLSSVNASTLQTSNVTNINQMFQDCTSLTNLDLSNWDTSNLSKFISGFQGCTNLQTLQLPDNFVTSNATNLTAAFKLCNFLGGLDISTWDTSNVTTMQSMVQGCSGITDLVGLETNLNITGINVAFGLSFFANSLPNQGTDYDALLIYWEANRPTSALAQSPNFNQNKVTTTAGNNARNSLINNYNWVITDGGPL